MHDIISHPISVCWSISTYTSYFHTPHSHTLHIHIHYILSHPTPACWAIFTYPTYSPTLYSHTLHIHIHYIFPHPIHRHVLPYSNTLHILPPCIHIHYIFTYTTYSHTLYIGVLGLARDHLFNLGCQKFLYSQTQSVLFLTFYILAYSA